MGGSLVFIHGTGVRDGLTTTLDQVRSGASKWLGLEGHQVLGPPWGEAVGPKDLDMGEVLPPTEVTKSITADDAPSDPAADSSTWVLLIEDPLLELRIAAASVDGLSKPVVGGQPAAVHLQGLLEALTVDPSKLEGWSVTEDEFRSAVARVRQAQPLIAAAERTGDAGDRDLLDAVARSVVATLLQGYRLSTARELPLIAVSGEDRNQLVAEVRRELSEDTTKGFVTRTLWQVAGPLALELGTRAGKKHRANLMDPISDFIRDVAFYIRRGDLVREYLSARLAEIPQEGPVVVVGHSLGGVAMVDLLSGANPPRVDLLVTAGSQAPFLYLLDAMQSLRPETGSAPFVPWLNLYSKADFLSFCASRIFTDTGPITDEEVDPGVPFPEAHSAYWRQERTYTAIKEKWP